MAGFKELKVWQKSMLLVEMVYELSKALPKDETYGLYSQVRRCTVSIASNIAEGYGRRTRGEYLQFLSIASGSSCELETQLILISKVYGLVCEEQLTLLNEVQRMLSVLQTKLRQTKP